MPTKSLFVDVMYAIAAGTALARINVGNLDIKNSEFWGIWFLLVVFLEDYYRYHTSIVPTLEDFPTKQSLPLEMAAVSCWYLAQVAFPDKLSWFFVFFGLFFGLELIGGLLLAGTNYPVRKDWAFLIPIAMAAILWFKSTTPAWAVFCLFCAWFAAIWLWHRVIPNRHNSDTIEH